MTEPVLNQWIEEESTVEKTKPQLEFDAQGNPTKITMTTVEEKVKQRVAYATLTPHQICENHYFEIRNHGERINGRLEVQCKYCGVGQDFVIGVHALEDGKIVTKS